MFHTKSLKSSVHFTLNSTAQFAVAKFKCSVATATTGYCNGEPKPIALRR